MKPCLFNRVPLELGFAVLTIVTCVASPAAAQPATGLRPTFDMIEIHDTNLLFAPSNREADLITRVTPGVAFDSHEPLLNVSGRYAFDAERFAAHRDLSGINGHRASIDVQSTPTRLSTFAVDGAFTETEVPAELNPLFGVALTRARAYRFLVHPSVQRKFGPRTTAAIDYSIIDDRYAGAVAGQTQRAGVQIERRPSERDVITVGYQVERFDFRVERTASPQTATIATANAVTVGWRRDISRLASVTLRGGPRVVDGRTAADIAAALHTRLKTVEMTFGCTQTQTALVGIVGVAEAQSASADAEWVPRKSVRMRGTVGMFRVTHAGLEAYGTRAGFEALRVIARTLAIRATYEANLQRGTIYDAALPGVFGLISRHVMSIGLVKNLAIGVQ